MRNMRVRQWAFVFWFLCVFVACTIAYAYVGYPSWIAFWIGTAVAVAVIVPALRRERAMIRG